METGEATRPGRSSEASAQQKHEEDGAEEDAECADGGNNDLCDHLHVANQWICNQQEKILKH